MVHDSGRMIGALCGKVKQAVAHKAAGLDFVVAQGGEGGGHTGEIGSLVLWPDATEPRLLSLVPPVHVALLDADRLYENFAEIIQAEGWANGMPTNALLISGPSKTADIEQTLAYGIHGPKHLITLLLG